MSLAVFVIRLATVQALKGATLAGDQVFDAPLDPLEDAVEASEPVIAVFSGVAGGKVQGRDLLGAEIVSELVLQVFLPAGVSVTSGGRTLRLDARGSGAELALEVISRQIIRTLLTSQDPWAELWRRFVMSIDNVQQQPFALMQGSGGNEVKVAAREITLDVNPLMDPPVGEPLPEIWTRAFAMMRDDAELAPVADWLELEASLPGELRAGLQAQAALGLTKDATRMIGLGPDEVVEIPEGEGE